MSHNSSVGDRSIFGEDSIREAMKLKYWNKKGVDPVELGRHPLAKLETVNRRLRAEGREDNEYERGLILMELLTAAWESLRPASGIEPDPPDEDWIHYVVIRERYLKTPKVPVETLSGLLGYSEKTVQNRIKDALHHIGRYLRHSQESNEQSSITHRYIEYLAHYRRLIVGGSSSERAITLEATRQPLTTVYHRRFFQADLITDWTLEVEPVFRDGGGQIKCNRKSHNYGTVHWYIDFDPPLLPGQRAKYIMRQTIKTDAVGTYEAILKDYQEGRLPYPYSRLATRIAVPTARLEMRLEFPAGYPVTLPREGGFDVRVGGADAVDERTRLHEENAFKLLYDRMRNVRTLELKVVNALQGYSYYMQFVPPMASVLEELKRRHAADES